ncbi:MAG: hypothetical protein RLZZ413_2233 [Pseudomonadota bacterium]|jgi:hypothetical protein
MKFLALFLCVASVLVPAAGDAATVSVLGTNSGAWALVDTKKTAKLGSDARWIVAPEILPNDVWRDIDPCVSACSPFDPKVYGSGTVIDEHPLDGWQTLPFFAAWAGPANYALLQFNRPQTALQLLWGSLDDSNLIEFFLGDSVTMEVAGAGLPKGLILEDAPGQGAALIRISGLTFDRVRFSSGAGAFEMSNITSAVPLPPALLLLAGAFGLLGAASRRRRT